MKTNQNNQKTAPYYIGLDIGTDSVGFAATDKEYKLLRHGGRAIWGVRLFDEGQTAEERRSHRVARRRLARRKWRLHLLRELFDAAIAEKDMGFFARMDESFLHEEDKDGGARYALFADANYTDADYHRDYPSVYHLRKELIVNPAPHDVRLVYLALHHIVKTRGHFLFDVAGDGKVSKEDLFYEYCLALRECMRLSLAVEDETAFLAALSDFKLGKKERAKSLASLCTVEPCEEEEFDTAESKKLKKTCDKMLEFLAGSKVKLTDLFGDEYSEAGSVELAMGEEDREKVLEAAGDYADLLRAGFSLYDGVRLESILRDCSYICEYKVGEYDRHKRDVRMLKDYVRHVLGDAALYKRIFVEKKEKLANYAAYSGYRNRRSDAVVSCSAKDFCAFLKKELGTEPKDPAYAEMFARIANGEFAPKLRTSANGVFPNGLYLSEVNAILKNAEGYLPFLSEKDGNGLTVSDKIRTLISFRIPYYVGPLKDEKDHPHAWMKRREGEEKSAIYPWNFEEVVNTEDSAEGFITRMTALCTYTGDPVLPKDSLLYSSFAVLNEINCITVGGKPITPEMKKRLYEELFVASDRAVTKKRIKDVLVKNFGMSAADEIGGVDDRIKSSLSSYHKLESYLPALGYELAEEVIRRTVLFGEDKKMLARWLKENVGDRLSPEDVQKIAKLRFKDWGRLSRTFLLGFSVTVRETGEYYPDLMHAMWERNETFIQILYNSDLKEATEKYRAEKREVSRSMRKGLDELYVSPKIRRSIWQTLRIVDEIVDVRRAAPEKIFIEVARDQNDNGKKGQRTESRKEHLRALYKKCKMEADELFSMLDVEDPDRLRGDKYYLYYTQFGRCMYCGKSIDLSEIADNAYYDIDHIYPRSKIKDDSLDNRVLVCAHHNRLKSNIYPIAEEIRRSMRPFWQTLLDRGTLSKKKFDRLVRHEPLTDDELEDFIGRQLVETRQSSKAVIEMLRDFLPFTEAVYSKAGHVSDFRHEFGFRKSRAVNDHHHAKDAYLNIVVGNFLHTRYTGKWWQSANYSVNPQSIYHLDVPGAWVAERKDGETVTVPGTIATVRSMMAKNNVLYTRQPRTVGGALYDLQPKPAGKGQVRLKEGLSIDRYGGYNKAKGCYFVLIEYTEGGKIVRSLEMVLLHQQKEYEVDPSEYAHKNWPEGAKIIIPRILIDSLLEINGSRLLLKKRTKNSIGLQHAYQFIVDQCTIASFARIEKYISRCKQARVELPLYPINGISQEENCRLYRLMCYKLGNGVYSHLYAHIADFLCEKEEVFTGKGLYGQCLILLEILKFFKCNPELSNLTMLDGVENAGAIERSKRISNYSSAYLIHQSVTGLFEYKTDLLRCEPVTPKK